MNNNHKHLLSMSLIAIFGSLVFVLAHFIMIPIGVGEIEFSDIICFLLLIISRKYPFIIIAIFPAFFSDLLGYPIYAFSTLISRVISTIIIILIIRKLKFNNYKDFILLSLTLIVASTAIIAVYFITDVIAFGISIAITDLLVNFIQYTTVVLAVVWISVFYLKILKKVIEPKLQ